MKPFAPSLFGRLLVAADKNVAEVPWGQLKPVLGTGVEMIVAGHECLAVDIFPVRLGDIASTLSDSLLALGGMMRYEDVFIPVPPEGLLLGVILAAEAHGRRRCFYGIDVHGVFYALERDRYEGIRTQGIVPARAGEAEQRDAGLMAPLVVGLRDFLLGLGRELPEDAMDREAIAMIAKEEKVT